ncbi:hypothetical protein [Henriciella sp.]|uniref:hypothetical protein n=1 Tax=Henriciella sp. TaxID=1968823 RepID=UPI00262878CC|nr:hypothetical protein [Henriciella sp.]
MIMVRLYALALLVAAGGPPAALAQEAAPPNLAGLWTFEANLDPVCRFNGQARLIPTGNPDSYDCELTAEQDCPSIEVRYVVEQSCQANVENDIVTVESTIATFLEGAPTKSYLPDDFALVIRNASHLEGILVGSSSYPAEWRRAEGAIS